VGIPVLLLLLGAVCPPAPSCAANWPQDDDFIWAGRLTAQQAQAAEDKLKTDSDNFALHAQLVEYYFGEMVRSPSDVLEEKREQHIFWLIEHHPQSRAAGSPTAGIQPRGSMGSIDSYQHCKQLWLQQVDDHAGDARVLRNAAQFVMLEEKKLGRDLLERAWALAPGDFYTAMILAQSYRAERMLAGTPEERAALSQKALAIRELALEKNAGMQRSYLLADTALDALDAGETPKAEQYATELLQNSGGSKSDWNYGNAIHKGHIVLGRVALRHGDLEGAKQHLIAAGETPGSPQLDSFGPNMTLAKELLEKGERDTVVAYLESCRKFWKMGGDKLEGWVAAVKSGGTPDFGANLLY
jgi:hypothetical protein